MYTALLSDTVSSNHFFGGLTDKMHSGLRSDKSSETIVFLGKIMSYHVITYVSCDHLIRYLHQHPLSPRYFAFQQHLEGSESEIR